MSKQKRGGKPYYLIEEEKVGIRKDYGSGLTLHELVKKYGRGDSSIKRVLGEVYRNRLETTEDEIATMRRLYDDGKGMGIEAVAKEVKRNKSTVRKYVMPEVSSPSKISNPTGKSRPHLNREKRIQILELWKTGNFGSISALAKAAGCSWETAKNTVKGRKPHATKTSTDVQLAQEALEHAHAEPQPVTVTCALDRETHALLAAMAGLRCCDVGCVVDSILKIGLDSLLAPIKSTARQP